MARSTFEGPVLSGDNRFGPLRNVGYMDLVQGVGLNFVNAVPGTFNYAGQNTQFVNGSIISNVPGTVYVPSATQYPPAIAAITADTGTTCYRGAVVYLPANSVLRDFIIDIGATPVPTSGALTSYVINIGNQFNGTQYGTVTVSGTGRQTITLTAAQVIAMQASTYDITNPPANGQGTSPLSSLCSQLVFTVVFTGTTLPTPCTFTAGQIFVAARYTQFDPAIGSPTVYPYGNLD